jgi:hypothetical protein
MPWMKIPNSISFLRGRAGPTARPPLKWGGLYRPSKESANFAELATETPHSYAAARSLPGQKVVAPARKGTRSQGRPRRRRADRGMTEPVSTIDLYVPIAAD